MGDSFLFVGISFIGFVCVNSICFCLYYIIDETCYIYRYIQRYILLVYHCYIKYMFVYLRCFTPSYELGVIYIGWLLYILDGFSYAW